MPLELSFAEMAGFGAIVAILAVLFVGFVVVFFVSAWAGRRLRRFKKLGIERTEQGHVQFSGFIHGDLETRVSRSETEPVMDRIFGPSKFPPREEEEAVAIEGQSGE